MSTFGDRLQHAWNAFMNKDPTVKRLPNYGYGSSYRPDRIRLTSGNERTIITAIYNRMSLDVCSADIKHIRLDENRRYLEDMKSALNECLTLSANVDQTGRNLLQDIVLSMFDEGVIAVVPVETSMDITKTDSYDIHQLRTAKILEWYPKQIKVHLYNENTGQYGDLVLPKSSVAIIENPFFTVMNEPNSTLQRLKRKLSLLDVVDEQAGSGKLDLIIQLPYSVKSELQRQRADDRRKSIEMQLTGSKYGIAYIDSTEHITQLNRSLDNNLLNQIQTLTETLYGQLGLTLEIMNGTADEKVMNNYLNRTIEPILSAIVDEMKRKFLTKTARSQKQSIEFFRDPFKLVPTTELAELADKFTRNRIMTANEFRQIVGLKPSDDPEADQLKNANISEAKGEKKVDVNGNLINSGQSEMEDQVSSLANASKQE